MSKKTIITLFNFTFLDFQALNSLYGKINSGDSDELDVDKDWCKRRIASIL